MAELTNELLNQAPTQEASSAALPDSLRALSSGTPLEAFLIELIAVGDELGVLDEAFMSSELESDLLSGQPGASREQIDRLVGSFQAVSPEQQQQVLVALQQEVSPEVFEKLRVAARLGGERV